MNYLKQANNKYNTMSFTAPHENFENIRDNNLINSTKGVMFWQHLYVCLFTKCFRQILMKFSENVDNGTWNR